MGDGSHALLFCLWKGELRQEGTVLKPKKRENDGGVDIFGLSSFLAVSFLRRLHHFPAQQDQEQTCGVSRQVSGQTGSAFASWLIRGRAETTRCEMLRRLQQMLLKGLVCEI